MTSKAEGRSIDGDYAIHEIVKVKENNKPNLRDMRFV